MKNTSDELKPLWRVKIMDKLEITLKITDKEGIIIGRSVILFEAKICCWIME